MAGSRTEEAAVITTPLQQQAQKLQITYRVLWPNETSRVFISDASRTDAQLRVERWQAWRTFSAPSPGSRKDSWSCIGVD